MVNAGRLKGVAITTVGVVILSPDALLIKLIDTDLWTMVFWRNLLATLFLVLYLIRDHGSRALMMYRGLGRYGLFGAACFGGGSICFVTAIEYTSTANTMAIIGSTPMFAAILSLLLLHERVEWRTWLAITCCLSGIGVIFAADLEPGRSLGNLAAIGAAAGMAGVFVCLRAAPKIDSRAMLSLGGFASAAVIGLVGPPSSVAGTSWPYLLVLGFFVVPVSFFLISHGPRYITAAEVSLIMLLEMVIAPWLVWLVLDEAPSTGAWIGGGVILLTLTAYYGSSLSDTANRTVVPAASDSTH